ncbi:hypothetical protein [Dactylosporangium sp. CA-139066]|uniref:hypothetical protein n=1 Tax=Dactylosporangium sp. CA-139066 TaxID=3239930 RepID=UPI003D8DB126
MYPAGEQALLRMQRGAVKRHGMPADGTVLDAETLTALKERYFRDVIEAWPPWMFKYFLHPPTELQDWTDWVVLAEGLTTLEGLFAGLRRPSWTPDDFGRWWAGPLGFGLWLQAILDAGKVTIGTVPMNGFHASARKVGDGYVVVIQQGLLRVVRDLVAIYVDAQRRTESEVVRQLRDLLDTYTQGVTDGQPIPIPEVDILFGVKRVAEMVSGRQISETFVPPTPARRRRPPRRALRTRRPVRRPVRQSAEHSRWGLRLNVLAPMFVILHELAHLFHGDAEFTDAEAAQADAQYDELAQAGQGSSLGPPSVRAERYADSDALEALIEMQRKVPPPTADIVDRRLLAMSPDVNPHLQQSALEATYLALVALHLVHEGVPRRPDAVEAPAGRSYPSPLARLDRLASVAVHDATCNAAIVETATQRIERWLWPAVLRVLDDAH